MATLTPERKLKKIIISLMRSPLYADYSGILMLGNKTIVDTGLSTAATDGWNEWYGRAFIEKMSEKALAFAVLHEGSHKLLRQLTVWRRLFELDQECANRAADYVINLMIIARDPQSTIVELPKTKEGKVWCCYDKRFEGMNTKQVFDILREEKKKGGGGGKGKGAGGGAGGGQPGGEGQPEQGEGMGEGETFDRHDWQAAKEFTKAEREQIEREIDQAIRQGQINAQKIAGKGAGNINRELQDLLEPKIDWKEVMRDFVTQHCRGRDISSWRRPNKRFLSHGICMPSMIGERVKRVTIGADTSGSISTELTRAISEVKAIVDDLKPELLDMIYWDAAVAGHEVYDDSNRDNFADTTQPKGGGGTDPRCMMAYMKKEKIVTDCIVMFTDGAVPAWGDDWDAPILWIVIGSWGKGKYASSGTTVWLED